MASSTNWYQDQDLLLRELQRGRRTRGPGVSIAGYDDLEELRRGGQGVVYRAKQRSTGQPVAIKVLLDGALASAESRGRFEREIDLVAGLRHPNIVRIYDSGTDREGRPYFVMEFIEGCALDELLGGMPTANGPGMVPTLPIEATLQLFARICDGVQHAHQRGVIHRDLKPSNIRVDPATVPHILDFGLAKPAAGVASASGAPTQMTQTGHFLGSLPWSSPEQAEGKPDRIDVRTDVYALGVMLYQALTGRFPYRVDGALHEVLDNIRRVEPPRPSTHRREIKGELDTIVLTCLEKAPERRYQSAGELARDLRHHLKGEPIEKHAASAWYAVRKVARRYRVAVGVLGVVLVASVGFAITMSALYRRAAAAEALADQRRVAAETAAEKARRSQAFLQSTLLSFDPELTRGRDVTVLRDLLDQAATRMDREFQDQPDEAAPLHHVIGRTYWSLGDYREADKHLRRELDLRRAFQAEDDRDVLRAMGDVGLLAYEMQDLTRAKELMTRTVAGIRRCPTSQPGDIERALSNLSLLYHDLGDLDAAESTLRDLLASYQAARSEDAIDSLTAKNNLAMLLADRGQHAQAAVMLREVLAASERVLGAEHSDTFGRMVNLAGVVAELGDAVEAERLFRTGIEGMERVLGESHPRVLNELSNFGGFLQNHNRLDEATEVGKRVMRLAGAALGPEHEIVVREMNNLAMRLRLAGRTEEAAREHEKLLKLMERTVGPKHPNTLTVASNLAVALSDLGRRSEAIELERRVLAMRREVLGDRHPDTFGAVNNLASSLRIGGNYAEAAALLEEWLQPASEVLPAGNRMIVYMRSSFGECLTKLERYGAAEPQLLAAYEAGKALTNVPPGDLRRNLERVIELYQAWGRPEKAEQYRRRLSDGGDATGGQ